MEAVERAARESYGKLVALVGRASSDLHAAEDAVSDALAKALETWPRTGVPEHPDAWLLTAARRRLIDDARRGQRRQTLDEADVVDALPAVGPIPDERLALLFACAHPAIDPAARTPLVLRCVLGVELERIASIFLVSPAALKKRLTRAKAKIRDARIRLETPEGEQLGPRLDTVLAAIYAALTAGVDAVEKNADGAAGRLAEEAIWLARITADLLPNEPEPRGLLALGLYCESRATARIDAEGAFVPLEEQNRDQWDTAMIEQAEAALREASAARRPGRFQIEAAIQSARIARLRNGENNWHSIVGFYDVLLGLAPSIGAAVGRAAAIAESGDLDQAWRQLQQLERDAGNRLPSFQPYWAVRGELLRRRGELTAAEQALTKAAALAADPAVRRYLSAKAARIAADER
ncbi:MAG: DUF6596 domain-containing protein [Planctomycetota bacterium]